MQKPTPTTKKRIAIKHPREATNDVWVCAIPDIWATIEEAECTTVTDMHVKHYTVVDINPLYDFDEVVAWLKSLE